jgi:DNA polymerase-3 subunit gamma/tau
MVTVATGTGGPTIKELAGPSSRPSQRRPRGPLVQAILETFPGARVANVKLRDAEAALPDLPPAPDYEEDDE